MLWFILAFLLAILILVFHLFKKVNYLISEHEFEGSCVGGAYPVFSKTSIKTAKRAWSHAYKEISKLGGPLYSINLEEFIRNEKTKGTSLVWIEKKLDDLVDGDALLDFLDKRFELQVSLNLSVLAGKKTPAEAKLEEEILIMKQSSMFPKDKVDEAKTKVKEFAKRIYNTNQ